ncbi:CARDB domain-containing protein [Halostella salina]|uniref:CARDB domain-containing protein n=1 Tax=Halostella salina TaxID=1547897 RepID=UPI000EF7D934|nr:CARDB domain-containing protein [Halostella salina]
MQFGGDERAAAIQVGATLLFGMIIVSMAMYQATVVPDQNAQVEYNHNQEVQSQMQELRNAIVSVPGGGNGGSVTVDLGTRFPSRTLFVNPPAPSGSLRTVDTTNASINIAVDNAAASGETNDYWNGDERTFNTGAIVYEPQYSEYQSAPTTVYEQSVLYNRFDGANVSLSDQRIVDGRQINLVALNGSLSKSSAGSASVSVRPVSTSRNAVAVEGDGGPINITIPTRLDNETWTDALESEYSSNGGNIVGQYYEPISDENYALLSIELKESTTYNLRMAKVGVGDGVTEEADNLYLTDVGGTSLNVEADGTEAITVEVRDRFNNPVSGEDVTLSASDGGTFAGTGTSTTTNASDSDGRVTVTYEAPDDGTESDTVTAEIGTAVGDGSPRETVAFSVNVETGSGGGGGSDGGGGSNGAFFEVTGLDAQKDPIKAGEQLKVDAEITNTGDAGDTQTVKLGFDGANDLDRGEVTLAAGETKTVRLRTDNTDRPPGDYGYTVTTENDDWSRQVTVEDASGPYFATTITGTNEPVTEGDRLTVDVKVENVGGTADTQSVSLDFGDDTNVDSESVTLDPGASSTLTLEYSTGLGDAGSKDVRVGSVNSSDASAVTVERARADFSVAIDGTNSPVGVGETLEVTAEITNDGDGPGRQKIGLDFDDDGTREAEKFVTLAAGETKTTTLRYDTTSDSTGDYSVRVESDNDSSTRTVTLQEPPDFRINGASFSSPITEGDLFGATVEIENEGGKGTRTVGMSVGSVGSDSTELTLAAGETRSVPLQVLTEAGDAGDYDVTFSTDGRTRTEGLTIQSNPYFTVAIQEVQTPSGSDTITETETIEVSVEVVNTGDTAGTETVSLDFAGRNDVDSTQVSLNGGGNSQTVTLSYETQKGDNGSSVPVTVASENESDSQNVEILALGQVAGTVTDADSDDPVQGVSVELVDGDGNVVETATTDANGQYGFGVPRGDYTVRFNGGPAGYNSTQTDVTVNDGLTEQINPALSPYTVTIAKNGGGQINTEFEVERNDGSSVDVDVYVQGNARSVTIDGQGYRLTSDARNRINNDELVDVFDEANYEDASLGEFNQYNGAIGSNANVRITYSAKDNLRIEVREKQTE